MDSREPRQVEPKNLLIDIDGTICDDIPNEEWWRFPDCQLIPGAKQRINQLYEDGHTITFFTSRTSKHRDMTINWLDRNGFRYHALITDKPRGGKYFWIDNLDVQGIKFNGNWDEVKI